MRLPEIPGQQIDNLPTPRMLRCARNHGKTAQLRQKLMRFSLFVASGLPGGAFALNDCLDADFQDRRGLPELLIVNDNPTNPFVYRPRCATISEGTRVRFRAIPDFGMHPLYGGIVTGGQATIDPTSPIGSITSGKEAERILVDAGEFPYFCDFHFASGMKGSIRVVPQLFADGFD